MGAVLIMLIHEIHNRHYIAGCRRSCKGLSRNRVRGCSVPSTPTPPADRNWAKEEATAARNGFRTTVADQM
jgi:hypothetical protein